MDCPEKAERLAQNGDFELRAEKDGAFFFIHRSGDRILTDGLGAAIWESLPGGAEEVSGRVRARLNAPAAMIDGFLRLMRAARIVREDPDKKEDPGPRTPAEASGRVSVVIVAFQSEKTIRECLDSILVQTYPDVEILVVDNASGDATLRILREDYPAVRVFALETNRNFAGGVNFGIRRAAGKFILVLNDDTALEKDAVERLVRKLKNHPSAGAAVPMMKFFNLRGFINGIGNHVRNQGWGSDNFIGAVDIGQFALLKEVPSACFGAVLLKRKALDDVGILDEGYTAYYEDIDWSFRARLAGWKIVPEPRAVVYHKFGASFGSLKGRKLRMIVRNRLRLVLKIFQGRIMLGFVRRYVREDVRGFFGCLKRNEWAAAGAYARAYASLGLALPDILFRRLCVLRKKLPGLREADVLKMNPKSWTFLGPGGLPQLNAHVLLAHYQREIEAARRRHP
jgi:GT2 family glycosyltransferase